MVLTFFYKGFPFLLFSIIIMVLTYFTQCGFQKTATIAAFICQRQGTMSTLQYALMVNQRQRQYEIWHQGPLFVKKKDYTIH
jgi:hypothetical protein